MYMSAKQELVDSPHCRQYAFVRQPRRLWRSWALPLRPSLEQVCELEWTG